MKEITKITEDSSGASHFSTESIALTQKIPGKGIQPTLLSSPYPAEHIMFFNPPPAAKVDWHPAPRRQLNIILSGTVNVEVSDGEKRKFTAGDVILLEDINGKGHRTETGTDEDVSFAIVSLV